MKYYTFNQNNSGGGFHTDEAVAEYVIIQAYSAEDANERAENIGIYFNGVDSGMDCPCCGDRWYHVSERDGYSVPAIYGTPLEELFKKKKRWGGPHSMDDVRIYDNVDVVVPSGKPVLRAG